MPHLLQVQPEIIEIYPQQTEGKKASAAGKNAGALTRNPTPIAEHEPLVFSVGKQAARRTPCIYLQNKYLNHAF